MLFLHQDMRQLDLYGTVSGAVCTLDSLNHILHTGELSEIFRLLHLFVEPEGLLIFDANTPYKHREILADNDFVYEEPEFTCVWRNRYLPAPERWICCWTFSWRKRMAGTGGSPTMCGSALIPQTWEQLLLSSGFRLLAVYGEESVEAPTPDCQRWVFVARNTPH